MSSPFFARCLSEVLEKSTIGIICTVRVLLVKLRSGIPARHVYVPLFSGAIDGKRISSEFGLLRTTFFCVIILLLCVHCTVCLLGLAHVSRSLLPSRSVMDSDGFMVSPAARWLKMMMYTHFIMSYIKMGERKKNKHERRVSLILIVFPPIWW